MTIVAASAHAAPLVNLGHVGGSARGSAIPGVAMPGMSNLGVQQPQVAQQTVLNLGHVAAAVAAQVAAQQAAAAAALATASTIPNGLAQGGLQVLAGGTWSNANAPTQAVSGGHTTVTIQQSAPQALLDWQTFNVGRQTTLDFDQQGNASWVVMNRVTDPSGVPSQILGQIEAPGQVYVINHNGVIFGAGSQVNTGSLIASSALLDAGAFTTSGIYSAQSGGVYNPSFTDAGGAIVVEPGAQISTNAPGAVTAGGGYVLLMGTSVSNQGVISTPDGQAALAAGDDFVIRSGYSTNGNSWSTTNGNEIAVQLNPDSASGTVSNTGLIQASTGDITLVGHALTQGGVALSTTSVDTRGTIHLLNSAADTTGSVTLAPGSVTAITPDTSGTTALASQQQSLISDSATQDQNRITNANPQFDDLSLLPDLEDESRVEIVTGGTAQFQGNSLTLAQGGQIAVSATNRVQIDSGANLDVSGTQAVLPMSANNLAVSIEGAELADAPTNRDTSDLNSTNVTVDVQDLQYVAPGTGGYASARYYTEGGLLEVSGELANVGQTIDQWSAPGGTIALATGANGAVVAQSGSNFNLSGGAIQYQAGNLAQSWLLGADGNIYNVNTAPASLQYVGPYNGFVESHPAWGVTKDWANPLIAPSQIYEAGYTVGANAGALILSTPTSVFAGDIEAGVETGQQQTKTAPQDPSPQEQDVVPQAGALEIGQYGDLGGNNYFDTAVQFGAVANNAADALSVSDPIPGDLENTAYFDANQLSSFGLGTLSVTSSGTIEVNAPLFLASGAQLTLIAPNVDVAADLTAHGGSIELGNIDRALGSAIALTDAKGLAQTTLQAATTIDTTGLWSNTLLDPTDLSGLPYINGGNVSIDSSQGVTLDSGSAIDASAGGAVLSLGKTQGGAGGNIALIADDGSGGIGKTGIAPLVLDGTLAAYGVSKGGTLTLQTGQSVVIANQPMLTSNALSAGQAAPAPVVLTSEIDLAAGAQAPFPVAQTFTTDNAGQSFPVGVSPTFTDNGVGLQISSSSSGWTVPLTITVYDSNGNQYNPGQVVPPGTLLTGGSGNLPDGYQVPAAVFPAGIAINPVTVNVAAGTVLTQPVTLAAGTVAPAGSVFAQNVPIAPLLNLSPALFSSGFSSYSVTGENGVTVAPGTQISVTEPVLEFTGQSNTAPTGSNPASALTVWTPPLYLQNPVTAQLTQRAGASLALIGDGPALIGGTLDNASGAVTIGSGAQIAVDPGQSIDIVSPAQVTVDGTLRAPSGTISITDNGNADNDATAQSIWIGGAAVLDVSAQAATALDRLGRPYGVAPNGGSIVLGAAGDTMNATIGLIDSTFDFIVVRPGAVLDAAGSSAQVDPQAGSGSTALDTGNATGSMTVAGNGGSISMSSYSGIYDDGTMNAAAGAAGAAGGTFNATLETAPFGQNYDPSNPAFVPSVMTISQGAVAPQLPASLQPGVADPSLQFGQARFGADTLEADGFGTLSFTARDAILFDGNVNLSAAQSIALHEGAIADTSLSGKVAITAPYVLLDGQSGTDLGDFIYVPTLWGSWQPSTQVSTGSFAVNADLIDIGSELAFGIDAPATTNFVGTPVTYDYTGFANVDLTSQGDIRFLPGSGPVASGSANSTSLSTSGDLTFTAAQLYPVLPSGVNGAGEPVDNNVNITAGAGGVLDPDSVITIKRISAVDPSMPYTALGSLSFTAATINQGGVVRAPEGYITLNGSTAINLLPGSITSTSMNGLTLLFGGTVDGITWSYNGGALPSSYVATTSNSTINPNPNYISFNGAAFNIAAGAVIDVSGGGDLAGAGFISGEGGSVNVLGTPLVSANPANTYSAASDPVYAILPGYNSGYAPVDSANGAAPGVGQQITIGAGVPGLPAGTYTLLPANYALLPGGYRVELGKATSRVAQASAKGLATGNGNYLVYGYQGVANTGIANALPTELIVTPGTAVRQDSDYDETNYSDFEIQQAAALENIRPPLTIDGGMLALNYAGTPAANTPALVFNGTALFAPGTDAQSGVTGQPGQVDVSAASGNGNIEIYAAAPTPGFAGISVGADALSNIGAPDLTIDAQNITLDSGVDLKAAQVLLSSGQGGSITLAPGAEIDTIGMGTAPVDVATNNVFDAIGNAELAVSNGDVTLEYTVADDSNGNPIMSTIDIGDDAKLYSAGSIGFASGGPVTISDTASFGTTNLGFSAADINIGDPATMAQANVPPGLDLTQTRLDQLLAGDTAIGVPPLQTLTLSASQSFNVFGSVNLDVIDPATGKADLNLVLDTPAIYGYGAASDTASLTIGTLTWGGIPIFNGGSGKITSTAPPGPIIANGPGTGSGTFDIIANQITFGFPADAVPDGQNTYNRSMVGFSTVDLIAPVITSNNLNTLAVYQAAGSNPSGPGTGGNLNLETSLLTGSAASIMGFTAGGALTIAPPAGGTPSAVTTGALGAEIDLTGNTINIGSTVMLPSGKLTASAAGDIAINAGGNLDVAGQATTLVDQTEYSWGGTVFLQSAGGDITQASGSTINVSAVDNNAGSITAQAIGANAGQVALDGTLLGGATLSPGVVGDPQGGTIDVAAQTLASGAASNLSSDFAALNTSLNTGGFTWSRSFDLKQGDLAIGNELQAHDVSVSVDNGSLSVDGTIDASGVTPGRISLAALNNLTLNGALDAHGTVLQVDSYANPIDAQNRGVVDLTTVNGLLTLAGGSTIDVSVTSPQGQLLASEGDVELSAPRVGTGATPSATGANAPGNATGNDVNISAAGSIDIKGAASIALNAFATYSNAPADPNDAHGQIIDQAYLDEINADSQAFIAAADANPTLQSKLAGLSAYGKTFHLRPGIELASATPNGDLTIQNDLDLSGYRYSDPAAYGEQVDSALYGSGEPGVLVLRAGGNLNIDGSVTDGFGAPPSTADDGGWAIMNAGPVGSNLTLSSAATIGAGSTFDAGSALGYDLPILNGTLPANTPAPVMVTLANDYVVPAGTPLPVDVSTVTSTLAPGTTFAASTVLTVEVVTQADWQLSTTRETAFLADGTVYSGRSNAIVPAGSVLVEVAFGPGQSVPANVFPQGIAVTTIAPAGSTLSTPTTIAAGTQLPAGTVLPTIASIVGPTLAANAPIPVAVTLAANYSVPASFTGSIVIGATTYTGGQTIPAGTVLPVGTALPDGTAQIDSMVWPAGDPLIFNSAVTTETSVALAAGDVIPAGTNLVGPNGSSIIPQAGRQVYALAPMLPAGDLSWSMQFVAGADTAAASAGILQPMYQLAGTGNLTLNDPHVALNGSPTFSVIRTGTGDLDLFAGGDVDEQTLYGIYTAGTQSAGIGPNGADPYNLARGQYSDGSGTVLGNGNGVGDGGDEAAIQDYSAYYPTNGGDLVVTAQGDLNGTAGTNQVSDWVWTQGGAVAGQQTAWWLNFGTYTPQAFGGPTLLTGFTGFGALGGGNVAVNVGGNANNLSASIGSTGRVLADGTVAETGGGALSVNIGGDLNGDGNLLVDLRGNTALTAGAIGTIVPVYGLAYGFGTGAQDPRYIDPLDAGLFSFSGGLTLAPGDGTATVSTRGDLVLSGVSDPGSSSNTTPFSNDGTSFAGGGQSWFSLWTDATAVNLFSAGGNLSPTQYQGGNVGSMSDGGRLYIYPSTLDVVAASGSIVFPQLGIQTQTPLVELAPAPDGELNVLAEGSIIGATLGMSGADPSVVPTPLNPAFYSFAFNPSTQQEALVSNISTDNYSLGESPNEFFAFGPDTPTGNLHANDLDPIHIYAATGDIIGLQFGAIQDWDSNSTTRTPSTWYIGAKPADIVAGGDIVVSDSNSAGVTYGFILNDNPTDVSVMSAGNDIIYTSMNIGGPGQLVVEAGGNYYAANQASLTSVGQVYDFNPNDRSSGAGITVLAGIGAAGPDYAAFANDYLNPADPSAAIAAGMRDYPTIVQQDDQELVTWLQQNFGYTGDVADAWTYFQTIPAAQQDIFLRQVFFAQLNVGGLEFNDPTSLHYKSYIAGRDAIAALFPTQDAQGNPIAYAGDITMFGPSGIHTEFGGAIQTFTPGGQTIVGVQGATPPGTAGILTQGSGDIDMYSDGSILLGQSRVMTTFGGNILMWSATGNINAGEGAKTTVVYQPPVRAYDDYGNVTLSPPEPSQGAGIATLDPIPGTPPGDQNLVAPEGTIDAGEAGIRVSGNLNVAALHVENAANIQVQGKASGIPAVAAVNTGALMAADAATSAVTQIAQNLVKSNAQGIAQRHWIITVQVEGFGDAGDDGQTRRKRRPLPANYHASSPVAVLGFGGIGRTQRTYLTKEEQSKLGGI